MSTTTSSGNGDHGQAAAADLIRLKLAHLYDNEPPVEDEVKEVETVGTHSKHQVFIKYLNESGKSVEQTQAEWHTYYSSLDDTEKHEVWREFHEYQQPLNSEKYKQSEPEQAIAGNTKKEPTKHVEVQDYFVYKANPASTVQQIFERIIPDEPVRNTEESKHSPRRHPKHVQAIHTAKKHVLKAVNANGKLKTSHHVKSMVFAVGFAGLVTTGLFFITNNEKFITPFITPSINASAAPLITDGQTIGLEPKIIIPKINLEAPLVTDIADNAEETIQAELEKGITLYPNTGKPGEQSNPIFFGHSSNNLFNKGAYKFVFVRLHQMEVGDTYAIQYQGTQYVYKIFDRQVVRPEQVEVLTDKPKPAMSTLITCDPPGTSNYRLVLKGEQISPSPAANAASTALSDTVVAKKIPSNSPSLLSRLFN